jgi:two-component sensor histidine kinase
VDRWFTKLRDQAAQIATGDYELDSSEFYGAPGDVGELSKALDDLAQIIAKREAEQRALALEVNHRVKNNLQIVTSLLNMQASQIENPEVRAALGQARARIGALALIHRIIYEQNEGGAHGTADVARLMPELCAQLRGWYSDRSEIEFSCHASSYAVPLDSALPLVLFAVEAVTNAYAYAFPNGRQGTVELHFVVSENDAAMLAIIDNGIGYEPELMQKSMGRKLMNGFAHQLGGRLAITSSPQTGTEVRLDYAISHAAVPADQAYITSRAVN